MAEEVEAEAAFVPLYLEKQKAVALIPRKILEGAIKKSNTDRYGLWKIFLQVNLAPLLEH